MAERAILGWLLIGLVAGALGKLMLPGRDPGGIIVTMVVGIAGALLAGFVAYAAGVRLGSGWQSYAAAAMGAVVLLGLYRLVIAFRTR